MTADTLFSYATIDITTDTAQWISIAVILVVVLIVAFIVWKNKTTWVT